MGSGKLLWWIYSLGVLFCLYIVVQQRLTETRAKLEKCGAEQTELTKRNIELQTSLNHKDALAKVCNRFKDL